MHHGEPSRIIGLGVLFLFMCHEVDAKALTVYMNKVWPAHNPVETYRYYDFPFCSPSVVRDGSMSLGQILRGDRLVSSVFSFTESESVSNKVVCDKELPADDVGSFIEAIRDKYLYEIVVEGVPISVAFGKQTDDRSFLCMHMKFTFGLSPSRELISGSVDCIEYIELHSSQSQKVKFLYSSEWTNITDSDHLSQRHQLNSVLSLLGVTNSGKVSASFHWISIMNSLILTMMILALVLIILVRVVRSDLASYFPGETEMVEVGEEDTNTHALWKLLHGDVFRPPVHRMWLCAAVGSGVQLVLVGCMVAVIGGVFGSGAQRGTLATAGVVMYMISSMLSGYVSSRMYQRIGGVKWTWNILVTALFFTGPAFLVWSILNTVAIFHGSTAAFPFLTILQLFAMWALVTLPLTIVGGILGRQHGMKRSREIPFPVKTNRLCREIPKNNSVFTSMKFQIVATGFIAFWSIYLELKFVFQSLWLDSQVYSLYGILAVAVLLLFLLVTALTVLFAYFHLNAENYKWWWRAFLSGGAVALFFMIYCGYFYATSQMSGVVQSSFFFLYSLLIAYAMALAAGAISFAATYHFVWFIFQNVKSD
jgi:transmembrane 9 superfamily member 1